MGYFNMIGSITILVNLQDKFAIGCMISIYRDPRIRTAKKPPGFPDLPPYLNCNKYSRTNAVYTRAPGFNFLLKSSNFVGFFITPFA